jgi:uncharacterized protein YjbI with pentapeptide repeats
MAHYKHLAILRMGVEAWNRWRKDEPDVKPELSCATLLRAELSGAELNGAELVAADLRWARLSHAKLRGAALSSANLSGADLSDADLSGADLGGFNLGGHGLEVHLRKSKSDAIFIFTELAKSQANVGGANLSVANLSGANLSEASLGGVHFARANLNGVDFTQSTVGHCFFDDVDLGAAIGLETVRHLGPSTVGTDTVYRSKGKIPEAFLRGCGLPDELITFMHSLVTAKSIQFHSCFISYSTKDQEFAERLYADLQANNVRCWFAREDVQGGRKLNEQIDEAIGYHDKLLLILSENSMCSEWVKTEIRRARRYEVKAGQRKLFPISLAPFDAIRDWEAFDADIGKDMAIEVREYFIPDFSRWKDQDAYEKAFDRLLRDLKAEPEYPVHMR